MRELFAVAVLAAVFASSGFVLGWSAAKEGTPPTRPAAAAGSPCGTGPECECKPCRADCGRCVSPGPVTGR